jgi:hypothetical protein
MPTRSRPRHLESEHQRTLIDWANIVRIPPAPDIEPDAMVVDYLAAIPNGGKRNAREAARMKGEGVKAGVSDLVLAIARQGAHGLWIEMKKPGRPSETEAQRAWRNRMVRAGYRAIVCKGWDEARLAIMEYLGLGRSQAHRGTEHAEGRP